MSWQNVTIGDLGRVVTGKTPPSSKPERFGSKDEYPFFTPTDLGGASRTPVTERFVSQVGRESMDSILLPTGSVGFVCIGATIGKMVHVKQPSFTNQQVNSVVVDKSLYDSNFVFYALKNQIEAIKKHATGAATPIINKSKFSAIPFSVPNKDVQERIGVILSAYDDLIENNNRRMALLEEAIHLLYREWFVYLRFPGHERVEVVDGVPEGWEKTTLSNVCDVNGASISKRNAPRTINYVDIRSVTTGHIDEVQEMDFEGAPSRARRIVRDGDIIWATVRPGNRAYALVLNPVENLIASTGFAVLTPTQVPSSFLYSAVTTDWFVAHMKAIAGGAAYPAVKPPDFEAYELLIPTRLLLKDFDEVAARSFQQMRLLDQQNQRLREGRDLLLPRLMDGRVPV